MPVQRALPLLLILLTATAFLILHGAAVLSALQSNMGWVGLNLDMSEEIRASEALNGEVDTFMQAVKTSAANDSAWFGLGLAYALQGKVEDAILNWSDPANSSATLIDYGLHARRFGTFDLALMQFRAAELLDDSSPHEASFLAGTICQRAFASQSDLSRSNRQYCSDYFDRNGDNLVVNGGFLTGSLAGWGGEHFFIGQSAARLAIEPVAAPDDFAVRLNGLDEGNHFGLFQRLNLSPGDLVRFSGRFKLSGEDSLAARLLYVTWQTEDNKVQGNHGAERIGKMEWTEFERTFRVPQGIQPGIDFYPVLFSGEGAVWFDEIELETMEP